MPPFIAEVARVLRPGGQVVVASSWGAATPFYTPKAVLDWGFAKRGIEPDGGRGGRLRHLLGRAQAAAPD